MFSLKHTHIFRVESVKELAWGLMGIHLLDESSGIYSEPSKVRKLIGLILILYILAPIILTIPIAIGMFFMLAISGEWVGAALVLILTPFGIGIYSIPGWIIIDWEKHRILKRMSKRFSRIDKNNV